MTLESKVVSLYDLEEELQFVTHDERMSSYTCILQAEECVDEHYRSSYHPRIWVDFYFHDETSYTIPLSDAPQEYLYLAENFYVSGHPNPSRSLIGADKKNLAKSRTEILEELKDRLAKKEEDTEDYNANMVKRDQFKLRRFYDGVYKTAFQKEKVFHKSATIEERRQVLPALEVLDDLLLNYHEGNYRDESHLYIKPTKYRHQIGSSKDHLNHKALGKLLSKKVQEFPDISTYTNASSFKHPYVDWYCIDMAFYQEYADYAKIWYFMRSGKISVLIDDKLEDGWGKAIIWTLKALWNVAWFVFAWTLVAVGIFFLHESVSTIAGYAAILLVVGLEIYLYKGRSRFAKILTKTRRLYGLVADKNINWKLVGRELEDLRKMDVIYPQTTWNIVDRNKGL